MCTLLRLRIWVCGSLTSYNNHVILLNFGGIVFFILFFPSFCSEPKKQSMQAVLEEEDNLAQIQERERAIKNLEVCLVCKN